LDSRIWILEGTKTHMTWTDDLEKELREVKKAREILVNYQRGVEQPPDEILGE